MRRKNTRRFDPRYYMDEKAEKIEEATAPTGVAAMGQAAPQENQADLDETKTNFARRASQALAVMSGAHLFTPPLKDSSDDTDVRLAAMINEVEGLLQMIVTQLEEYGSKGPR